MTPERWRRIDELFQATLDTAPEHRAAFLDDACSEDSPLRRAVESLLAADERMGSFIESPAVKAAAELLTAEPGAAMNGGRVGHYRIVRELGRGGMGTVYLAERADGQFQQRVAIKIVRHGFADDFIRRRFLDERQILATLAHPNIARLLDGGATEAGLPYLVMEYIEGQPIDEYCDARRLGIRERLELFRQVCSAVQYAHQNLVVHRDLKPGNILVTSDGVPKLLDFGIAKLLDPALAPQEQTLTGQRLMTPEYASPEQARSEPVTTASDVYSLGVLLYRLLTGQSPYQLAGLPLHEATRVICEQEPERPSAQAAKSPSHEGRTKLQRALAGDLDNIALAALRKEPARRYSSVEQFAEDIRRHLTGLPVQARQATFTYQTGKFIRRQKKAVAATVLIFLILLGGIVATLWQAQVAQAALRDAKRERAEAEAQTRRAETEQAKTEAQRDRAEQALAARAWAEAQRSLAHRRSIEVRRATKTVLIELQEEIKKLPGSMPAQGLVVKYMLEYLNGLANEASGDPSLRRELAVAYERVGDIQGNSSDGELGDLPGALASYRRALAIRQTLPRAESDGWQDRYRLIVNYRKLGDVLSANRQRAEAAVSYSQALALVEDWARARPQDGRLRKQEVLIHRLLGAQLRLNRDEVGARAHARQARTLLESLLAQGPINSWPDEWGTGREYYELGVLSRELGDLDEALRNFHRYLAMTEAELATSRGNTVFRRNFAGAQMQVGDVLLKLRRYSEAALHFRQAVTIDEELSAQDPANARARRAVSSARRKLATALKESGERAEALTQFQRAVEIDETLAAQNPTYTPALNLAANHEEVAELAAEVGEATSAVRHYQRALVWREEKVAREPSNPTERVKLGEMHCRLADALRRNGKPAESLGHYRRALALGEEAVRLDPANGETRWQLSRFLHRIANCLADLNDTAGAFESLHRALVIREALAAEPGASVFMRIEPTYIHIHLGELHAALAANEATPRAERMTHWQAARAWYAKSLAIFLTVREQGLLPARHAARPDEIASEIAKCDAALAKLQGSLKPALLR